MGWRESLDLTDPAAPPEAAPSREPTAASPSWRESIETPPSPAPPPAVNPADPYAQAVAGVAERLPLHTTGVGGVMRTVGGFAIPQTTPELAAAAVGGLLTAPVGGWGAFAGPTVARAVGPAAAKVLGKGVGPFLARTGIAGAAGAGAGAATGYNPWETGAMGALGQGVSEVVGRVGQKYLTSQKTLSLVHGYSDTLATEFRKTLPKWVPEGVPTEVVLLDVLNDGPAGRIGKAMNDLRDKHKGVQVTKDQIRTIHQNLGIVWPEMRVTGPKQIPGTTGPTDLVKVGDVWQAVDGQLARAHETVALAVQNLDSGDPGALAVLKSAQAHAEKLDALRTAVAGLVPDPKMQALIADYAKAKTLRNWMVGTTSPSTHGVSGRAIKQMLDPETGRLSMEGVNELLVRLQGKDPQWTRHFTQTQLNDFANAIGWDFSRGAQHGVVGEGWRGALPDFGFSPPGYVHLHPKFRGVFSSLPWAETASLVPRALAALGAQVPLKFPPWNVGARDQAKRRPSP